MTPEDARRLLDRDWHIKTAPKDVQAGEVSPLSQRMEAHAAILSQPNAFIRPGDAHAALADICIALTRIGR